MYGRPSDVRHMPCGPYMPLATLFMSPSGVTFSSVPALLSMIQIVASEPTAIPVGHPRWASVAFPPAAGSAAPPPATTSTRAEVGDADGLGATDSPGLG